MQVLSVLWEKGESTVRQVLENLPDGRPRAYTTALSVLQTMERKGLVSRKTSAKAHVYKPKKTEKQILGPMMKELAGNIFGGSAGKMLNCALDSVRLTESEKKEVTATLKAHKAKKG
ncbi:MAG: BlaI/MecI/CopY family transcriptional regulator [Verrucomicrobiota bacterium]